MTYGDFNQRVQGASFGG